MTKIKLKCISAFQPKGIIEVEQKEVKSLLDTGNFILIEDVSDKTELKLDKSKKEFKYGKSD